MPSCRSRREGPRPRAALFLSLCRRGRSSSCIAKDRDYNKCVLGHSENNCVVRYRTKLGILGTLRRSQNRWQGRDEAINREIADEKVARELPKVLVRPLAQSREQNSHVTQLAAHLHADDTAARISVLWAHEARCLVDNVRAIGTRSF